MPASTCSFALVLHQAAHERVFDHLLDRIGRAGRDFRTRAFLMHVERVIPPIFHPVLVLTTGK